MRELNSKQVFFHIDDPDISIETFTKYCAEDNVFAFHWGTEQWLPAIIIGPQFRDDCHPVHFWQDYPDFTYIVDPRDIRTLRKCYDLAYIDGEHDGRKFRNDELQQAFDNGYLEGKQIQSTKLDSAFEAGRRQGRQDLIDTSFSKISTVRASAAFTISDYEIQTNPWANFYDSIAHDTPTMHQDVLTVS